VHHAVRRRDAADHRADIDDAAAFGGNQLGGFTGAENQAQNVGVEMLPEIFFADIFERLEFIHAGVVDEDIELAVGLLGFGEQPIDVGWLGNVGLHRNGFAARAGYFGYDAISVFLAGGIIDDHRRAFARELLRDGGAD